VTKFHRIVSAVRLSFRRPGICTWCALGHSMWKYDVIH